MDELSRLTAKCARSARPPPTKSRATALRSIKPIPISPMRSEARLFAHGAYLEQLFGLAGRLPIDPIVR